MRAELHQPDDPETVLAIATWDGHHARIETSEGAPEGTVDLLRPTPVVVEDPSLRRLGTRGEILLEPGTLEWFRAALVVRGRDLGLAVRFVPGVREGGWDPAAQYRTFGQQVGRLISAGA